MSHPARIPSLAAFALSTLVLGECAFATVLTGQGDNLQLPSPNPGLPDRVNPSITGSGTAYQATWAAPASSAWIGTYKITGQYPSSAGTGTSTFDFSALGTGVLPSGTYFLLGDLDIGAGVDERLHLTAYDGTTVITTPWLDTPIGAAGTGVNDPLAMPGWEWNSLSHPYAYTFDGTKVTNAFNPLITIALASNTALTSLLVVKPGTMYGFGLAAPVSEPGTFVLTGLGMLGICLLRRRRAQ